MGTKWLLVLLGALALLQNTWAEEEEFEEETPEIEEEEAEEAEEHSRVRRQSGCSDILDYCAQWPDSYCQTYKDYMKTNCQKKCGYCSGPTQPPVCVDKSEHCAGWKSNGYCDRSSQWYDYMKKTCAKTCGFCGGGGGGGGGSSCTSGASNRVKGCNFDSDTCEWHDVPFDDNFDFQLKSGASSGGPSSGNGGSGGYLLTKASSGKAQLELPLELVLPHNANYNTMCLRFHYYGSSGSIKLYEVDNARGQRKSQKLSVSVSGSQWKCARQMVRVSTANQLLLEASVVSDSPIAIDDISFADSC